MLTTANNKTKRMIQERVPDNQASFLYKVFYIKFFIKSLQNFTIMFKNIQYIKSDVDKQ